MTDFIYKVFKCEISSFFGRKIEKIAVVEFQNCHFLQNTCSRSFEIECNLFSFYRLQLLKGLVHFSIWLKKRSWIFYCHVDSYKFPDGFHAESLAQLYQDVIGNFVCPLSRVSEEKKSRQFAISMAFRIIRQRKEARRNAKLEEIFEVNFSISFLKSL